MSAALLTAMPARLPSATRVSASAGPKAAVRFAHTEDHPVPTPRLERDGDRGPHPELARGAVTDGVVRERVVLEVVVGDLDAARLEGLPGEAGPIVDTDRDHHLAPGRAHPAVICPALVVGELAPGEVDRGAVATHQARRVLDDLLEDERRVADLDDALGQLAKRPLRLHAVLQRPLGPAQLLDQAGPSQRDRGLTGDGLEERLVGVVEGVRPMRPDRQGAERPVVGHERCGDRRRDRRPVGVAVGTLAVDEARVVEVVAGAERPAGRHRLAGHAFIEALVGVIGPQGGVGRLRTADVRAAQEMEARVDEVHPGTVAVEEPQRLVDRALDDVGGLLGRGQGRAQLPERPFRLGPPRDVLAGTVELGDERRVREGRGGMLRERAYERDLRRRERVALAGEGPEGAVHPAAGLQRRDDHGADSTSRTIRSGPLACSNAWSLG